MLALAVLVGGYTVVIAIRRQQPRELPPPAGAYAVGRTELQLQTAATDPTSLRREARRLSVWLWYPADRGTSTPAAPYAPGLWGELHFPGVTGFAEGPFDRLRLRAVDGASAAAGRFSLVVFEPGLGFAAPQYPAIAESLASAGLVVAVITPTHSANVAVIDDHLVAPTPAGNPPGLGGHHGPASAAADRLVDLWSADARSVAAQLHRGAVAPVLDRHLSDGTLYAGHSFGGAAALQACADDDGCRGAADLDGTQFGRVVHTGVRQPLLLLGSEDSCITGTCGAKATPDPDDVAAARSLLRASVQPASCLTLTGARHFDFTDYGTYYLAAPLSAILPLGSIDGRRALEITSTLLATFARRSLTGSPAQVVHDAVLGQARSYRELVEGPGRP